MTPVALATRDDSSIATLHRSDFREQLFTGHCAWATYRESQPSGVGHRQPLPRLANVIAAILDTPVIERILENLGPARAPARASMPQAA